MPSKRTLCGSIKTATLVIAALDIISAVTFLIVGSLGLVYGRNGQESVLGIDIVVLDILVTVGCSFAIGGGILDLALTALLISAVTENKPRRCIPWLIFNYIKAVSLFIMLTILSTGKPFLILPFGICVGVQLLFIRVVHEFKDGASADSVV